MSETVRTYSRRKGGPGFGFNSRRSRGLGIGKLVLVVILMAIVGAWWTTRDTRPVYSFVDRTAAFQCTAPRFQDARFRVSNSPLWAALPADHALSRTPEMLTDRFGLPEWLYRNLVPSALHVWGHDADNLSDAVVVSRMSRIGTLAERFHRVFLGGDIDWAGGLRLRTHERTQWVFAVRGRVLIAARSREALVRALTLSEERQWTRDDLELAVAAGAEDIRGIFRGGPDVYWRQARFAARLDANEGLAHVEVRLNDEGRKRWAPALGGGEPSRMAVPLDAPVAIAVNTGVEAASLWQMFGEDAEDSVFSRDTWRGWRGGNQGRALAWLCKLAEHAGPYAELTWHGFDLDARQPVPLVRGRVGMAPQTGEQLFAELGETFYDPDTWEALPYRIEPHAIVPWPHWVDSPLRLMRGGDVVAFETDSPHMVGSSDGGGEWQESAHALFRFSPGDYAALTGDAGQALADYGLLRDRTPEEYARERDDRIRRLARIGDVRLALTAESDSAFARLHVMFEESR
jgi:hypothetical protein